MDSSLDMSRIEVDSTPVEDAGQFNLLVADDSTSLRAILRSSLEKSGFTVTTAESGREAWELLQKAEDEARAGGVPVTDRIHLVISDIEMPEMDGHELTAKIRANPATRDMPVILFSSLITEALRVKGDRAGADRQVSKPDLPGLNSIIRELIVEKLHR
jgi:two-component system chemotaxis response regulator CheV